MTCLVGLEFLPQVLLQRVEGLADFWGVPIFIDKEIGKNHKNFQILGIDNNHIIFNGYENILNINNQGWSVPESIDRCDLHSLFTVKLSAKNTEFETAL